MNQRFLVAMMVLAAGGAASVARADGPAAAKPPEPPKVDLATQPTLYVVGYAHLDTEWRWAYPQTIREFIPNTLHQNFSLFDKYPSYVFNFSGSRRYQMMKEYYPEDYAKLKEYVAAGRWFPCGSSVDENDANVPSAESYVRHILYGNKYFRREFGVASEEYMLPDCFGFPAALPSVLAHCGIKGFSTQKLTWGLAIGQIPFKVGEWEGPDGKSVIAALDPESYTGVVRDNLATSEHWASRIDADGAKSGVYADYHYYGTGDQGGAPKEGSVAKVEESVHTTDGHTRVISGPADWMFRAIAAGGPEMAAGLPRYKGELELTNHSAGSISSEAYMKRWNRKNEQLAQAAELAAVGAWQTGAVGYPAQRIEDAWTLVLGSQMHDILPGTSIPKAYEYAWNDEVLASNIFADVEQSSVGAIADGMDTRGEGVSVVVYNPLACARRDIVELTIPWEGDGPVALQTAGSPVQVLDRGSGWVRIAFDPDLPAAGLATYAIQRDTLQREPWPHAYLSATDHSLENERYAVKIDANGDVSSIYDKSLKKEMLTGPARLEMHYENPKNWPAWNQDWEDRQLPVRAYVGESGPVKISVVESGPVRAAVRVERECEGSVFVQEIRLAAGAAGDSLTFHTHIDWNTRERSLRAAFPLAAGNPKATYDIQTGVIERGNGNPAQFENAAHMWVDTTDASGEFGASLLNDCKYGSDKPGDHTLRLTLLYTPGARGGYPDQATQDLGRHEMDYAFYSHAGDWRAGKTAWVAARLNQPVRGFVVPKHDGAAGKAVSLVSCDSPAVMVTAVKKAEDSDEVIVRLRELTGQPAKGVHVKMSLPAASAREVDGQEREVGAAVVANGELVADVQGYGLRAYAVKLNGAATLKPAESAPVALAYDTDVASTRSLRDDGEMEAGRAYPAERIPAETTVNGVKFRFGPTGDGQKNAVACKGQEVALPGADFDRVEFLASASDADTRATFSAGGKEFPVSVQWWRGYVGQWDNRRWGGDVSETNERTYRNMVGLDAGYIKPDPVAWFCSHYHLPTGDDYYKYCYMFRYAIDLPKGATSVKLPDAPGIKVMAMTAVRGAHDRAVAAAPLRDMLADHGASPVRITVAAPTGKAPVGGAFTDSVLVKIMPSLYWHEGGVRYTMDGTEPTPGSPAYERPFWLSRTATIKAASFDYTGKPGMTATQAVKVNDTTAPSVKSATAVYQSAQVRVDFSEPVDKATGAAKGNYSVAGSGVLGVELAPDSCSAVLTLDKALTPDRPAALRITGVKDASPAGNAVKGVGMELVVHGPVYQLDKPAADEKSRAVRVEGVKRLPTRANQAWTINMWIKPDAQPVNRTLFGGFGRCEQAAGGCGRYLGKFANGVHFWSHNADVETHEPLTIGKWQMLTATCDGATVRVYKDAKKIAEQPASLSDDEPVVNVLPVEPWEHKYQFDGGLREFTVWDSCLTEESLRALKGTFRE